jgi:hypothetical protein
LFLADQDNWIFQCDLSGADGWTVAAYCAMLGDSTMLDDYKFGLKPAKILVLSLRGSNVDFSNREALKEAGRAVKADDWDYFGMKRVQHGCSYLEGPIRVSNQILVDSEGKFILEPAECKRLRDGFFFKRYPGIQRWHTWIENKIRERPTLIAASGQVRHFFGQNDKILPKAVAFEPQANTTYATNLAMYRLWTDLENRIGGTRQDISYDGEKTTLQIEPLDPENRQDARVGGSIRERDNSTGLANMQYDRGRNESTTLRIEPLHQVHDALLGQFKKTDTTWAVVQIRKWFDNPLYIAGQKITIPFEGSFGRSWGEPTEGEI